MRERKQTQSYKMEFVSVQLGLGCCMLLLMLHAPCSVLPEQVVSSLTIGDTETQAHTWHGGRDGGSSREVVET